VLSPTWQAKSVCFHFTFSNIRYYNKYFVGLVMSSGISSLILHLFDFKSVWFFFFFFVAGGVCVRRLGIG
jgi:hypothetical protein